MADGDNFTIKEMVVEIRNDVRALTSKLDRIDREGSIGTKQEIADHENRLRDLEGTGFRMRGAWAAITIGAAVVAGVAGLAVGVFALF